LEWEVLEGCEVEVLEEKELKAPDESQWAVKADSYVGEEVHPVEGERCVHNEGTVHGAHLG
jgi:hypothetical protein